MTKVIFAKRNHRHMAAKVSACPPRFSMSVQIFVLVSELHQRKKTNAFLRISLS